LFHFKLFEMASVLVLFSPGFLSGAGFSAEQSHHGRPHGKKQFFFSENVQIGGKRTPQEPSSLDSELL
jgi:hypothetical protein